MKIIEFIQKALSESADSPSAMRVNTFYIVVVLTTVIALGFIYTVLFIKELLVTYLTFVSSLIVTALGAKYLQRREEDKTEIKNEPKPQNQ